MSNIIILIPAVFEQGGKWEGFFLPPLSPRKCVIARKWRENDAKNTLLLASRVRKFEALERFLISWRAVASSLHNLACNLPGSFVSMNYSKMSLKSGSLLQDLRIGGCFSLHLVTRKSWKMREIIRKRTKSVKWWERVFRISFPSRLSKFLFYLDVVISWGHFLLLLGNYDVSAF